MKVKLLILGESGVGKSCLLYRFTDDKFMNDLKSTMGVEFRQKILNLDQKSIIVQVWDTAGQERFRTITPIYYKNVQGVIFVYDITNQESFQSIDYWIQNLKEHADQNVQRIMVGSKIDKENERQVDFQKAKQFADENDIKLLECSSKSNKNVDQVFDQLVQQILDYNPDILNQKNQSEVQEITKKKNKKWSFC